MTAKQYVLIPVEKAQDLGKMISSLPIPYLQSRPMIEILETAQIVTAEPKKEQANGTETQQ